MRILFLSRWRMCALLLPLLVAQPQVQSSSLDADLLEATGTGDVAAVAAVLAKGANVNTFNQNRATPLYIASEQFYADVVDLLLEHGADPNMWDMEKGRTPLMNASVPPSDAKAKQAGEQIIRSLLAKGAGTEGESLKELILRGHVGAAQTIVGRGGADPSYLNVALGAAKQVKATALIEQLVKAGAKDPGPLETPAGRAKFFVGVYRNTSGQQFILRQGIYEDQLLLDRPGQPRVGLLPMDLLHFRTVDLQIVVGMKAGPLPPSELTLGGPGRSDVYTRTADAVPAVPTSEAARTVAVPAAAPSASRPREWEADRRVGNWPSFRGPAASGVADGAKVPTVWNVDKGINIKWKTPIPGLGHSSPVIWNDRIFITTAVPAGNAALPFVAGREAASTAASANRMTRDDVSHTWRVYALDKQTGRVLWERVAHEGIPRTARHVNESQANSTPATDGRYLIAFFGSEGLYCYDLHGKLLWKRDLGPLHSGYLVDPSYQWNTASSPIIYKQLVIIQVDLLKKSFIAAFDIRTGKDAWRTERDEVPSWPTPLIYEGANRTELVTVAPTFARGYNPDTGKELWRLGKHSIYSSPTPIAGHGLIFLTSAGGNIVQPIYAVRPGAVGDITPDDDQASNEVVVWSQHRGGSRLATPIFYRDLLYINADPGVVSAYVTESGQRVYQARLPPNGYTASPVAADGKIYFPNSDGDVVVVEAGATFKQLAVNSMGEVIQASPAISMGMLVFRTQHHVIAVADSSGRDSAQ